MSSFSVFSQNKLPGYYLTKDPFTKVRSVVYLYKTTAGSYAGKVYKIENDTNNSFLGYLFLWNLKYDSAKHEYSGGSIKYPGVPGTYRTFMKFENDGSLKVRGYLGLSLLGVTVNWKRVSKDFKF